MGLVGASTGAVKSLEEIVADRILRQKLAQEIEMRTRAFTEQQRSNQANEGLRTRTLDLEEEQMRAPKPVPRDPIADYEAHKQIDQKYAPAPKPERDPLQDYEARKQIDQRYTPPARPERDPLADYEARKKIDQRYDKPAAGGKLPAAMAQAVAAAQTSLDVLDRLEGIYTQGGQNPAHGDAYIGPAAGRYNKLERGAPGLLQRIMPDAPKGFEDFAAESATLKNQVIQAITGAAVGVQEQGRILEQIPDVTDTPMNWKAKAAATRRNLQALMANQVRMGTGAQEPAGAMSVDVPAGGMLSPYQQYLKRKGGQ